MTKRILSFLLALVLIVGMFQFSPAYVHAEDIEDPAAEQAAATEECSAPVDEDAANANDFVPETSLQCDLSFADVPSSDELFAEYAQNLFYNIPANYDTAGGARLSGNDKLLYDELIPVIQQIANGDRSSTTISFGQTVTTSQGQWIADVEMTFSGTHLDLSNVFYALMEDFPYEMYWFDNSVSMEITRYYTSGREHYKHIRLSLPVVNNYKLNGDLYTIDTAKTSAAKTAAANAKSIVAQYADKSDYEKLLAYKEEICARVEYDHYAADNNTSSINKDPWQLIYCFDDDPATNVVCAGYAKAYKYLCDLSLFSGNVTCHTATGSTLSSTAAGDHMWNIVSVNGRNYLVDVTNSEPKTIGKNGELFLMGTPSGNPSSGYLFEFSREDRNYSISYTYDDDIKTYWGTDSSSILNLDSSSCKNHDFTDWCQVEASSHEKESRLCSLCGFMDHRNLDHIRHSYTEEVVAPTCAKMGYTVHICQCGDSYKDSYVNALRHTGGNATCTEQAICTRCEKAYGELDQSNHFGGTQIQKALEATCISAGYTGDTHCSGCGVLLTSGETIPAKDHSFTQWVETKAPTCVHIGIEQRDCENCDYYELRGINATGHRYTVEVIAPTCTQKGYTRHFCACGYDYLDTYMDALGHTGGIATCNNPAICTRCNLPYGEWDPSKHVGDTEVVNQKAVTCTRSGYTGDTVCKACGERILYGDIIKATGHDYTIQVVAPTYTEKGYTLHTCSVCGHQITSSETDLLKLPKITIKVSNNTKTGKPIISWTALDGEVTYKVYRADKANDSYKLKKSVSGSSYEDTSAVAGKTYYYKVKVVAGSNSKDSSYTIGYCKLAAPTLKTAASTSGVKLSWKKVSNAKKYDIYRATSKNGTYTKLKTVTGTSYTDASAKAGKTYYYKVKAVASKSSYNSAYSAVVSGLRICAKPVVKIALSSKKPKLSWNAVSGAKRYEIYRATSQNGSYTKIKTTTSRSFRDTTAKKGKTYYYKVKAVAATSKANSAYSSVVKIKSK